MSGSCYLSIVRVVSAFCFAAWTTSAFAWWDMGHMQVAAIAYEHLDPGTRTTADALIKLNPSYQDWIAGLPADEQAEAAFVHAATWADDIKNDPAYTREPITSPDAARNLGYADRLAHDYWHYVDIPFSPDGTLVTAPLMPNALTEIRLMTDVLSSNADPQLKSYDLTWLLHLVGDVHQPLHATQRFTTALGDDRGGNDEKVTPPNSQTIALHLFWDGILGDRATPAEAIAASHQLPEVDVKEAAIGDPAIWIIESFTMAQNDVYTALIGPGAGPFALDEAYVNHARAVAQQRVALAGIRLAHLLNAALR